MIKNRIRKNKCGQEEMVGFAIILILVAIIALVLLVVYVKKPQPEKIDSPEVNSFVQSFLQYTTTCEQNSENITLQKLISKCKEDDICAYNKDPCNVLNDTLKGILNESWWVGPESSIKGYSLVINVEDVQLLNITKGVVTNDYKTGQQNFSNSDGEDTVILFNAYG